MRKAAKATVFLAIACLCIAARGTYALHEAKGFDAYGVYCPVEKTAGPGGCDTGIGIEERYYVFKPGYACFFSPDSTAPPDVPLTAWRTEYWAAEFSPQELEESGLSSLTEGGSAFRKHTLQKDYSGDVLYEKDGQLWMRMQVGLAEGGVWYVYRLEKLPEAALEEAFGVDYAALGTEE